MKAQTQRQSTIVSYVMKPYNLASYLWFTVNIMCSNYIHSQGNSCFSAHFGSVAWPFLGLKMGHEHFHIEIDVEAILLCVLVQMPQFVPVVLEPDRKVKSLLL
jgi:hypothetical protein